MRNDTKLKQQALMLKAAFEEGYQYGIYGLGRLSKAEGWDDSTAKQMHDQLLMEAKGDINVKANVGNG